MSKKVETNNLKALEAALAESGISLENLRNDIQREASAMTLFKAPAGTNFGAPWVRDVIAPGHEVGETWSAVISAPDGKAYEVDFTIEAGKVKITGTPAEVIAQVEYEPATGEDEAAELETRNAESRTSNSELRTPHSELETPTGEPLQARGSVPFDYAEAPKTFMWMPSGTHFIKCGFGNKDWAGFVACQPGDEKIANAALEAHIAAGRKPFTDFDHQKLEASSWPKRFTWQDSPAPGIYVEPEWTSTGLEAVAGKKYRGFSAGFYVDAVHGKRALTARAKTSEQDPARLIGTPLVMGGLTNIPAFADMEPLWARAADTTNNLSAASVAERAAGANTSTNDHRPINQTMILTAEELQARATQLETKIQELTAKNDAISQSELRAVRAELDATKATIMVTEANNRIAAFEARETKRKENAADEAVETMVTNGVLPALDKELKASYRAKFIADPELIPLFIGQKSPLVARQTPGAADSRFSTNGSRLIYGEKKVKAISVLKQGVELVARSSKIKRITPTTAQEKGAIARELHALYANDVSENNDLLNMRMSEIQDALEASTDSDSSGTLAGTLVLQRTLQHFRLNYPLFSKIYTDFSDQPALLNQTLETRTIGTLAVQTYNNTVGADGRPAGWDTVSPASTTDVPISVDEHVGVPVVFGSNTLSSTLRRVFDEMAPAMSYALAKYFVAKVYALFTAANYNAYAAIVANKVPVAYATYAKGLNDFARSAMVDLNMIFNPNEVPIPDRIVLLNSAYYAQVSKDPSLVTFYAGQQHPEIISEGELPKMSKFIPIEAPDFPSSANRVGMALQKNGVIAISRIPQDYTKALPGASYGTSTMITDETGMTLMLVQYVNHTGGYAESRMETMIGAKVGDKRGGLVLTQP